MSGIMVTGGSGQVAAALGQVARTRGVALRVIGRPYFDFDRLDSIDAALAETAPAVVVNAAAYTAVDRAEREQDAAWRANHAGPARLAARCAASGIRLVHLSTDYVFDGRKDLPYVEADPTGPTGVYGASKLAGERAVLEVLPEAMILRTAWVYAARGHNFLLTMLNAAARQEGGTLRVVDDQFGCPTLATDLAAAILDILAQPRWQSGVYHAAGSGWTSWHGFAAAIFEQAALHGQARPMLAAIRTTDWPTPAQRPANSRLDCGKLLRAFGVSLPPWRDSVRHTVDEVSEGAGQPGRGKK